MLLYVDDILLMCLKMSILKFVKLDLNNEFDMNDLGYASRLLQMSIIRNKKKISCYKLGKLHVESFGKLLKFLTVNLIISL